jgi:hypothetical protein
MKSDAWYLHGWSAQGELLTFAARHRGDKVAPRAVTHATSALVNPKTPMR